MPWTDDIHSFKQNMFKFDENDLNSADKSAAEVVKVLVNQKSSPSAALATFVVLLGDFIASNVDPDRWDEALDTTGRLTNAALARFGLERGLLKIGSRHVQ